jgi:hypothetical protein
MKTILLLFFFVTGLYSYSQNVHIPDANFKNALVNFTYADVNNNIFNLDANGDGEIQVSEASSFTGTLDISSQGIADLTGLEAFTAITELFCGGTNLFTVLDLSANIALRVVYCENSGKIENLDVTKNTALEELYCYGNNLDDLDITKNTVLTTLDCSNNQLTNVNFNSNVLLNQLVINDNKLTSIDLTQLVNLKVFLCSNFTFGTNELTTIDFSKNLVLENIQLKNIKLQVLDLSKNLDIIHVKVRNNEIENIDLSANDDLKTLLCEDNKLTNLNVANGFNNNPNANFTLQEFRADNNPNLNYICVDDVVYANNQAGINAWSKDVSATYTTNCTLSVDTHSLVSQVSMYPNPVRNVLNIEHHKDIKINFIKLYDLKGVEILKTNRSNIDLSMLKSGIYFAKIKEEKGGFLVKKIIKL